MTRNFDASRLNESAESLGEIAVQVRTVDQAGSCNFCRRQSELEVVEVSGHRTVVRFCLPCFKVLKEFKL